MIRCMLWSALLCYAREKLQLELPWGKGAWSNFMRPKLVLLRSGLHQML